jgi:hypothetical protein
MGQVGRRHGADWIRSARPARRRIAQRSLTRCDKVAVTRWRRILRRRHLMR